MIKIGRKIVDSLMLCMLVVSLGHSQNCKWKFAGKLESNSILKRCEANFTLERLPNGIYIAKQYYMDNLAVTEIISAKDQNLTQLHGFYEHRWDDGTLVSTGMYVDNLKEGSWIENEMQSGFYVNGKRQGEWRTHNVDSMLLISNSYVDGILHGRQIWYDSLENVSFESLFEHGELISTTRDTSNVFVEEFPLFPGCEDLNLDDEEMKKCADRKLLEFVYSRVRYPASAREQGIQGRAIVRYVISKEGKVQDINVLNGLSEDIKQALIDIFHEMPRWQPGIQNGKPVNVVFTMPVQFRLE